MPSGHKLFAFLLCAKYTHPLLRAHPIKASAQSPGYQDLDHVQVYMNVLSVVH